MESKIDVYGVSDIALELTVEMSRKELKDIGINPGTTKMIGLEERDRILNDSRISKESLEVVGYSYKVLNVLTLLGMRTGLTCKIGMDEFGMICQRELERTRIDVDFKIGFGCTDSCLKLRTPEDPEVRLKHRGISKSISYQEIDVLKTKSAKCILIETALLDTGPRRRAANFAARIARDNDSKIIFDVNSVEVVLNHKEAVMEMMALADAIIISSDQAYLLFGENIDKNSIGNIKKDNQFLAVKGNKGFNIYAKKDSFFVEKIGKRTKYEKEFFTAGITLGIAMGYRAREIGKIASFMSSKESIDDSILDELNRLV